MSADHVLDRTRPVEAPRSSKPSVLQQTVDVPLRRRWLSPACIRTRARDSGSRPRRRAPSRLARAGSWSARRAAGALLSLLLLAATAGDATAQTLRYAGREGETDRYRLINTMKIHQDFQGVATDLTVLSHSLLSLTLERSRADTLTYGVTFDSLNVTFEGAPLPAPDLSPILGRKMTLQLSPTGEVFTFEVPEDMPALPPGFDLKQMVSHFFPRLPGGKARPGTTWSDTLDLPVSQQGIESNVTVVTRYTSKGESQDGSVTFLEIEYGTTTTISGKGEQGGTPLVLDGKGKGGGTILFREDGETFWSSRGKQTLELVVDVTPEGQPPMSIPVRQEITAEIQHL